MSPRRTVATICLALGLAGCASTAPSTAGAGPSSPPSPAVVALDEHANHTTVKVGVGSTVRIALHSTYWSNLTSSAPQLLQPSGTPSASADPSCHPGGGCGTLIGTFQARTAGTAQLTAERTSCGEAMACSPDQRSYTVTITIG